MRNFQKELKNFLCQYSFFKTSYKYDILLVVIYLTYELLGLLNFRFIEQFAKFNTLFIIMFIVGIVLSFANNKLKQLALLSGIICIIYVATVLTGNTDCIVYTIMCGAITFCCYKMLYEQSNNYKEEDIPNEINNNKEKKTYVRKFDLKNINVFYIWKPLTASVLIIVSVLMDWIEVDLGFHNSTVSISNIKDLINGGLSLAFKLGGVI